MTVMAPQWQLELIEVSVAAMLSSWSMSDGVWQRVNVGGRCRDLVCFVSDGRAGGEMHIVADKSRRDRQRGEEAGKRELVCETELHWMTGLHR